MTGAKRAAGRDAYRASGVDVAAGERAVDLMRGHVDSTAARMSSTARSPAATSTPAAA